MGDNKRKRGRKTPTHPATTSPSVTDALISDTETIRPRRGRPRNSVSNPETTPILTPARRSETNNGVTEATPATAAAMWMDAVVKVFCTHTEANFSLPWQRKRQYSSSSSGFVIGGRRVLTNAHSVEHYTQVKLKKRGSDTKYVATVLAIGTECDIDCFSLVGTKYSS